MLERLVMHPLGSITFFGAGGLRALCVLACAIHSLAIVITIVQSLLFFLSFFSVFPSARDFSA